ncbi:MAG: hypothetical protein LBV41_02990 [Cytophagaceae bacterium]|jgi:hypothetical protein|nr:hypothetical protein [Cytophagaceae bacterium]
MRKASYIVIAAMTAMSIACIAMGATHHVFTLGICAIAAMFAWGTRDDDDGIVEFNG